MCLFRINNENRHISRDIFLYRHIFIKKIQCKFEHFRQLWLHGYLISNRDHAIMVPADKPDSGRRSREKSHQSAAQLVSNFYFFYIYLQASKNCFLKKSSYDRFEENKLELKLYFLPTGFKILYYRYMTRNNLWVIDNNKYNR